MRVDEFITLLPDYPVSHEQLVFARYLERGGKRLCVDFGFDNAEAMTWDEMDAKEIQ